MKLFNTLSKQIETLQPIQQDRITIYSCGPTVYDYPHIGNWFTFIRYDLLIRTLTASGFKPKWVMNITDVGHLTSDSDAGEDKLAKGARREGKNAWDIAAFYSRYFLDALQKLNFSHTDYLPRATDNIAEQIEMIIQLAQAGYTYKVDEDGIYYDISKFDHYGQLAGLHPEREQEELQRITHNTLKRHQADFALWKFSPKDVQRDMEWDSPWGKGFPGWHIECSAMCRKFLGECIDIHCGGVDHIPIHHTNEIAQSEALSHKPLARIWMHSNHLLIDDQKIAKSLGNSITLEELEKRGFSLEVFRLLVLESHYRNQSKFSWQNLQAAKARLLNYHNFAARRFQTDNTIKSTLKTPGLLTAMQEDLNSPQALQHLDNFLNQTAEIELSRKQIDQVINEVDSLFGLRLSEIPDISQDQKQLIQDREKARIAKDWHTADTIRAKLAQSNITVLDTPLGPRWAYID